MAIEGREVVRSNTLKQATDYAIKAARSKIKDPMFAAANAAQIELLQLHMLSDKMTDEELTRAKKTIALFKANKIRYNLTAGFVSHAEEQRQEHSEKYMRAFRMSFVA